VLKKTIKYEDFNGDEATEDFYFHLSKAELVEMEMSHQGGMHQHLQNIVDSQDGKAIMAEFKNLILSAYGIRSEDGKRFIKNQALRDEFVSTEAYSQLFFELCTQADKAAEFINGVVPTGLEAEMANLQAAETPTPLRTMPFRASHRLEFSRRSKRERWIPLSSRAGWPPAATRFLNRGSHSGELDLYMVVYIDGGVNSCRWDLRDQ
jgi:hypothetical protein